MHILLDGAELEVTATASARVADFIPHGCWIDGRHHAPQDPLVLYAGAAVTTVEPPPGSETAYVLDIVGGLSTGRSFPLPRHAVVVGRAPDCDIVLEDPTVSPR